MNYFCIRFDPEHEAEQALLDWIVLDDAGRVIRQGASHLADLKTELQASDGGQLLVVVAGDRILTTEVAVESQHAAHIKNVLPYLLEEQIAEDLDDVHIAPAPNLSVGTNSVAVVSHTELIDWLDQLYSAELEPYMIVPETLTLPDTGAGVRVLLRCDEAVVQYDDNTGSVLPIEDLAAYLHLHFGESSANEVKYVTLLVPEGDSQALIHAESLSKEMRSYTIDTQIFSEPAFALQAITLVRNRSSMLNLLQGGYRTREASGPSFPWSKLAAIAAAFLMIEFGMLLGSGWWFESKAARLNDQAEQQYKEIFPSERRVVDARRQFQSHLNRQQSAAFSDEFLYLMERVASSMDDNPLPLKSMRYNAYGEGLLLDLSASSMDALESYTAKLSRANLEVELLSAVEEGSLVKGRLRVEAI